MENCPIRPYPVTKYSIAVLAWCHILWATGVSHTS
uniref:Uncharacterized protein n=1 Tax=Arundo donax TaxID=35708 RepID=A0A0A9EI08_ARUDO